MNEKVELARRYLLTAGKITTIGDMIYISIHEVPEYFKEACTVLCNDKKRQVNLIIGENKASMLYEFRPRKDNGATVYVGSNPKFYVMSSPEKGFKLTEGKASDMYANDEYFR